MKTKITCLGVLMLGEASGYEIRQAFEHGPFSHFADAGFGSIYPSLITLTKEGLATCVMEMQEKRPAKKIYAITEAGRAVFLKALEDDPGEDKYKSNFLFSLFFADNQNHEWLAKIIDQRIAWYKAKVAELSECSFDGDGSKPDAELYGPKFVHGFGIAVYTAASKYLEDHRDDLLHIKK
jgi:DNA-binding PadR family transcriptional regulator